MKKIKSILIHLSLVLGVIAAPLAIVSTASAVNVFTKTCPSGSSEAICKDVNSTKANSMVRDAVNLLFYVIGIAAVIVIIIAGIKYVVSDGDSAKIKSARETILYAIIGLVIAMLAFAIVQFVVGRL